MLNPKLYLAALVVVVCNSAWALEDYRCTIDRVVYGPSSDANVQARSTARFKGQEFTVSRRTGVMSGALKNAYVTAPVVVDIGSSQNSYKVTTTLRPGEGSGPGSYVYLLVVREYTSGPIKPFMFAENDEVYFGTCRHY
jgi:hypothetical protein